MLGLSQARLSREILLLGFLYVHSSFPWTAPSRSGAQAQPARGTRPPPPCRRWMLQQDTVSLETGTIPPRRRLCPSLNKASSSLRRGLGLHFSLSLSPAHSSHSSCDKLSLDSQLTTLPLM